MMFVFSSWILICFLNLCVFSFNHQRLENDNMCKIKGGVLCIKNELMTIAKIGKGIIHKSIEIEKSIQQTKAFGTLNGTINAEIDYTHSNSPISYYHNEFFRRSNIDKEFLIELVFEAHDAMIFYHNSIDDVLNLEDMIEHQTDTLFKKIKNSIKDDIICRYRSILDVYSQKWKFVHEINRIQFSRKHLAPSLIHNVHSGVIARYLKEWIERINEVIDNLEMKFL